MRESVLKNLAERAATDPEFLGSARRDLAGTLERYGYDLTAQEMEVVEDLRRRTAVVGDGTLAAMLASGLRERTGGQSVRPAAPARPGSGLPRPRPPDAPGRASRQRAARPSPEEA